MTDNTAMVEMYGDDYAIRFAYRTDDPTSPNLPLALTRESWDRFVGATEGNIHTEVEVETTMGQRILLRKADCGARCYCALSWRYKTTTLDGERASDVRQLQEMLEINGVAGVLKMLQEALVQVPGVEVV